MIRQQSDKPYPNVNHTTEQHHVIATPFSFDHTPESERSRILTLGRTREDLLGNEYIAMEVNIKHFYSLNGNTKLNTDSSMPRNRWQKTWAPGFSTRKAKWRAGHTRPLRKRIWRCRLWLARESGGNHRNRRTRSELLTFLFYSQSSVRYNWSYKRLRR